MNKEKTFTKIFIDEKLPFVELRYSNSNMHYKKHFHDTFSLGVNKKGVSNYLNNGISYTLDKNMLSIINPNIVHSCNSCSDTLNVYYMLYLNTNWCASIQKIINKNVNTFVNVPVDILEDENFYNEYINLCEFLFSDNYILDKEDLLYSFFIKFFSLFLDETKEEIIDKRFTGIVSYLEKNYKENISIDDL